MFASENRKFNPKDIDIDIDPHPSQMSDEPKVYECLICQKVFAKKPDLERHLKRVTPCQPVTPQSQDLLKQMIEKYYLYLDREYKCKNCDHTCHVYRVHYQHIQKCREKSQKQQSDELMLKILQEINKLNLKNEKTQAELTNLKMIAKSAENQVSQLDQTLKHEPRGHNNLMYLAFSETENIYDKLEMLMGHNKAIVYMKDCAISSINNDCLIADKGYRTDVFKKDKQVPVFSWADNKEKKVRFLGADGIWITEDALPFVGRLARSILNGYSMSLKWVIDYQDHHHGKLPFGLTTYDIEVWNQHIINLNDPAYHKKMLKGLHVPSRDDFDLAIMLAAQNQIEIPKLGLK